MVNFKDLLKAGVMQEVQGRREAAGEIKNK
jgi:hypothetical protein